MCVVLSVHSGLNPAEFQGTSVVNTSRGWGSCTVGGGVTLFLISTRCFHKARVRICMERNITRCSSCMSERGLMRRNKCAPSSLPVIQTSTDSYMV